MPFGGGLPTLLPDLAVEVGAVLALGRAAALLADLFVKLFAVSLADDGAALLAGSRTVISFLSTAIRNPS